MAKDEAPPAAKGADKTAESAPDAAAAPAAPANKSKKRLIMIAAAATVVLAGGGAGAWFFLKGSGTPQPAAAAAETPDAEADAAGDTPPAAAGNSAQYLALHPAFVVNLDDDEAMRYLQLEIELMARDASALEAVNKHMPVIRNNLLMLFGTKRYHEIDTREGKEALRLEALAEVQKILTEQTGSPGVEQLYFTSLVMQ